MTYVIEWDGADGMNRPQVPQRTINTKRVCAISDLHEKWLDLKIPNCDLLVVAGDLTYVGDYAKVQDFNNWCYGLQERDVVKEVVVIAGNHDLTAQRDPETFKELLKDVTYLCDEQYEWNGLRIYGSPWTPSFFKEHWVFNADRGAEIQSHWAKIPAGLDILITHGPAYGVRDMTPRGERVGCYDLRQTILDKKPRVHIFGHIHHDYGLGLLGSTLAVNASSCTENYKAKNAPLVIDL